MREWRKQRKSHECPRSLRTIRRPRRNQKVISGLSETLLYRAHGICHFIFVLLLFSENFHLRVSYERDTKIINAASFTIEREEHTIGNILRMYFFNLFIFLTSAFFFAI